MLGPIDYYVIGFNGLNFDGSITEALEQAVQKGAIRVIDLVFVAKDANGDIAIGEYQDQLPELRLAFSQLEVNDLPLLTEDDIGQIAEAMDKDTAAAILVIEHLWARDLKQALVDAGGFLLADGRIHPEAAVAALREVAVKE